ncbi:bacteriophage DNA transposition protein A, putative, partial [Campylobacter jejuni subsp. jejuni 2008-979]
TSNLNLTEPKIDNDLAVLNIKFENLSDEIKNNAREKLKSLKQVEKYIEGGLKQKRALELCGISKIEIFRIRKAYKENGILGLVDTRG